MIPVQWVDERAVMAHELGAARFLIEHFMAGTANDHVRREAQAWLDRARGAELARSSQTGQPEDRDQSNGPGQSGQAEGTGRSGASPFEWLGE